MLGVGTVDLQVFANEIFGLVGELGSGKTTLGMGVLGSLPASASIVRGAIRFAGKDLVTASPGGMAARSAGASSPMCRRGR